MKLSRTVAYALQATLQLAEAPPGTPVPCSQLAANGHMPERFLLQILRQLVNHGILHSTRGVDGGYSLELPAKEISLLRIIEAIDGPVQATIPTSDNGSFGGRESRLRELLDGVAATKRRQLEAIKLADLLGPSQLAKLA